MGKKHEQGQKNGSIKKTTNKVEKTHKAYIEKNKTRDTDDTGPRDKK